MNKFNKNKPAHKPRANTPTVTHEGAATTLRSAKEELATLVVTTMLTDTFYESGDDKVARMQKLVSSLKNEGNFLRKLAVIARKDFGMRSSSTALLAMMTLEGVNPGPAVAQNVLVRPDDYGNYMAAVKALSKKGKVTVTANKNVASAMRLLTERGALRYLGKRKDFSLSRVIQYSHPVPKDEKQAALFKLLSLLGKNGGNTVSKVWTLLDDSEKSLLPLTDALANGGDTSGISYQHARSSALKDIVEDVEAARAESWEATIGTMSPFAIIRNLRNMLRDVSSDNKTFWDIVHSKLKDEAEVKRSGIFPHQIYIAYKEIFHVNVGYYSSRHSTSGHVVPQGYAGRIVAEGLNAAFAGSFGNYPLFKGKVLVASDSSGSMTGGSVAFSKVGNTDTSTSISPAELAGVLAVAISYTTPNSVICSFDSTARVHKKLVTPTKSLLESCVEYANSARGGATYLHEVMNRVSMREFDEVIVLSDMQFGTAAERFYASNPKARYYMFNLVQYAPGAGGSRHPNVQEFGGFTAEALRMMGAGDGASLVEQIEAYDLPLPV